MIGDFNGWDALRRSALAGRSRLGIWSGVVAEAHVGDVYKFAITTADGALLEKADPVALATECPPRTGSVVCDLSYEWSDDAWMASRGERTSRSSPVSIYELHLGSWTRSPERPDELLSYTEIAPALIAHVRSGRLHPRRVPAR